MSSSLSFPVSLPATPAQSPAPFAVAGDNAADAGLSFEALLSADPAQAQPAQSGVSTFPLQAAPVVAEDTSTPALTPAQLAELLSLMNAPAAPPPVVANTAASFATGHAPAADEPSATTAGFPEGTDLITPTSPRHASPRHVPGVTICASQEFGAPSDVSSTIPVSGEISAAPSSTAQPAASQSTSSQPSVRDLLADGAETILFELMPAAQSGEGGEELPVFRPVLASPAVAQPAAVAPGNVRSDDSKLLPTPAPDVLVNRTATEAAPVVRPAPSADSNPTAAPSSPVAPVSAPVSPVVSERALPASPVGTSVGERPINQADRRPVLANGEKTAASFEIPTDSASSGVLPLVSNFKNKILSSDNKDVTEVSAKVGTDVANWGDSMKSPVAKTPAADVSIAGLAAPVAFRADSVAPAMPAAKPETGAPVAALQMVREIRDIADGLWAVERNSVEVRFRTGDGEPLSVRVEYKDGVVSTTFRTASPELRDTLAREWQAQIGVSADARPYRVADPVFNTPTQDERSSFADSDASGRQQQARHDEAADRPGAHSPSFGSRVTRSASADTASPSGRVYARPDTALHLHALA